MNTWRIAYIVTSAGGFQRSHEIFVAENEVEQKLDEIRKIYPITCIEKWS